MTTKSRLMWAFAFVCIAATMLSAQKCPFANECVFGVNPSGQWKAINVDASGNLLMNMSGGGGFVSPVATCPFPGACPQAVTPAGAFAPLQIDSGGNLLGNCQSGCGSSGALPSTWSSNGTTNITAGPTSVFDLSGITTGQFKTIAAANGVSTASQQLVFDSTAGLMHVWNGADSILPQSKSSVSHQWINAYSMTTGVFSSTQPACADLSNSAALCSTTPASGVATFLTTPSSANLAAALTDETGTGAAVFANSPSFITPNLGTPSNLNLSNATALPGTVGCVPGSPATLTDGATVTWAGASALCPNATLTFTVHSGSRTLNLTGLSSGATYIVELTQDATGGENLTGGTGCTWKQPGGGGSTFTLTATASALDVLSFYYDGTNCIAGLSKAAA